MPLYGNYPTSLTQDVIGSGIATIPTTINSGTVTWPKIQNLSSNDRLLGTATGAGLQVTEIPCFQVGRDLLDDTTTAQQRVTLGVAIGTDVQAHDATLDSLSAYNTNGFIAQTAPDTFVGREITAGTGVIVTNGNGVSGNPVINAINNFIQSASGEVVSDQTTTSGTLVDLAGATVTINITAGSKVKIDVSFSMSNSSALGSLNRVALVIDGSPVPRKNSAFSSPLLSNFVQGGAITHIATGLSAGNHTFKLQWSNTAGTSQCRPVTGAPNNEHASITVMEFKS